MAQKRKAARPRTTTAQPATTRVAMRGVQPASEERLARTTGISGVPTHRAMVRKTMTTTRERKPLSRATPQKPGVLSAAEKAEVKRRASARKKARSRKKKSKTKKA